MRIVFLLMSMVIAISTACFLPSGLANNILQYELNPEKVVKAWVSKRPDGYFEVIVELNETEREKFAKLTEANVDEELQITFLGQLMTRAIVQTKIDSGIISVGRWKSKKETDKFLKTILP